LPRLRHCDGESAPHGDTPTLDLALKVSSGLSVGGSLRIQHLRLIWSKDLAGSRRGPIVSHCESSVVAVRPGTKPSPMARTSLASRSTPRLIAVNNSAPETGPLSFAWDIATAAGMTAQPIANPMASSIMYLSSRSLCFASPPID
jgi:hypothetical protein